MANSLRGKVVLITGASSGFGEDTARLFAKEGYKVVLAARRLEKLQELASAIQSQGGQVIAVPVDVNQKAEMDVIVPANMACERLPIHCGVRYPLWGSKFPAFTRVPRQRSLAHTSKKTRRARGSTVLLICE